MAPLKRRGPLDAIFGAGTERRLRELVAAAEGSDTDVWVGRGEAAMFEGEKQARVRIAWREKGQEVGSASFIFVRDFVWFEHMALKRGHRRRGFLTRTLALLAPFLSDLGIDTLAGTVNGDSAAALRRLGFEPTSHGVVTLDLK